MTDEDKAGWARAMASFDWWIFRIGGVALGVGIATSPIWISILYASHCP